MPILAFIMIMTTIIHIESRSLATEKNTISYADTLSIHPPAYRRSVASPFQMKGLDLEHSQLCKPEYFIKPRNVGCRPRSRRYFLCVTSTTIQPSSASTAGGFLQALDDDLTIPTTVEMSNENCFEKDKEIESTSAQVGLGLRKCSQVDRDTSFNSGGLVDVAIKPRFDPSHKLNFPAIDLPPNNAQYFQCLECSGCTSSPSSQYNCFKKSHGFNCYKLNRSEGPESNKCPKCGCSCDSKGHNNPRLDSTTNKCPTCGHSKERNNQHSGSIAKKCTKSGKPRQKSGKPRQSQKSGKPRCTRTKAPRCRQTTAKCSCDCHKSSKGSDGKSTKHHPPSTTTEKKSTVKHPPHQTHSNPHPKYTSTTKILITATKTSKTPTTVTPTTETPTTETTTTETTTIETPATEAPYTDTTKSISCKIKSTNKPQVTVDSESSTIYSLRKGISRHTVSTTGAVSSTVSSTKKRPHSFFSSTEKIPKSPSQNATISKSNKTSIFSGTTPIFCGGAWFSGSSEATSTSIWTKLLFPHGTLSTTVDSSNPQIVVPNEDTCIEKHNIKRRSMKRSSNSCTEDSPTTISSTTAIFIEFPGFQACDNCPTDPPTRKTTTTTTPDPTTTIPDTTTTIPDTTTTPKPTRRTTKATTTRPKVIMIIAPIPYQSDTCPSQTTEDMCTSPNLNACHETTTPCAPLCNTPPVLIIINV